MATNPPHGRRAPAVERDMAWAGPAPFLPASDADLQRALPTKQVGPTGERAALGPGDPELRVGLEDHQEAQALGGEVDASPNGPSARLPGSPAVRSRCTASEPRRNRHLARRLIICYKRRGALAAR